MGDIDGYNVKIWKEWTKIYKWNAMRERDVWDYEFLQYYHDLVTTGFDEWSFAAFSMVQFHLVCLIASHKKSL